MENKRDIILQAAEQAFLTNGYDNASIKDIAKQAAVAPSHPYFYFGSKADMLKAVLLKQLEAVRYALAAATEASIAASADEAADIYMAALAAVRVSAAFIIHCELTPKLGGLVHEILSAEAFRLEELLLPGSRNDQEGGVNTKAALLAAIARSYFVGADEERTKQALELVLGIEMPELTDLEQTKSSRRLPPVDKPDAAKQVQETFDIWAEAARRAFE
ncbi:MAG: TetR/AcrR family transcriptional regulator [Coriobacteriia bacterium]|nr:TetR/AcrR family transcriptional regulator [Coriobacteriia bacterium]